MIASVLRMLALPALTGLVAAAAWLIDGATAGWACLALGASALLGWHLFHLSRFVRWAEGPLDAPVPEAGGSWGRAYGALYRRVRQRSARQRDLRMALERFITGAEALPDGIVVLDARDRIQWANTRAAAHLGVDRARDVGAAIVNLVRQPSFVQYLQADDFREPVIVQSSRESGMTLSVQIVPYGVEEKLLMSRDITRLETVARLRRDFIANVSHELKTPLTVLAGFLETLADLELDSDRRRRYLGLMQEQAGSMQRLVDDLLTLSTLESERPAIQQASIALGPLLERVAADARALSGGRHEIALAVAHPATLKGNRDELASAFGNLVSNAVRYTPDGGSIDLGWRVENGAGIFSVRDTGIGIESEHLPRLTERFYRVDRSRSRATGGTGLGLAIVKHVLIRHQARLDIASEPGRGSTFSVRFPPERVSAEHAPTSEDATSISSPS